MKLTPLIAALFVGATVSASAAEAPATYAKNCAACHGKDGAGQTKAGKQLDAKDFTDAAYQKTYTDAQAFTDIKNGLKDKSGKQLMKPFAEKLTDDEIKTLIAYVRTLQK